MTLVLSRCIFRLAYFPMWKYISRVAGVTIRCSRRAEDSNRVSAAITARSAQSGLGRGTCLRKTATSCRSTRISASFAASFRQQHQPAEQPDYEQVDKTDERERRA